MTCYIKGRVSSLLTPMCQKEDPWDTILFGLIAHILKDMTKARPSPMYTTTSGAETTNSPQDSCVCPPNSTNHICETINSRRSSSENLTDDQRKSALGLHSPIQGHAFGSLARYQPLMQGHLLPNPSHS